MSAAILKMLPEKRGRRSPAVGAEACLQMFPSHGRGRRFMYAIAFHGGVVKMGMTSAPRGRLRDHWKRGNGEVLWVHLFTSMHERTARGVEMSLPAAVQSFLTPVNKSEWFRGDTDKARILSVVRGLIDKTRAEVCARLESEAAAATRREEVAAALRAAGIKDVQANMLVFKPQQAA